MVPVYGCGGSEIIDCSHVLNSKWSKVFGLPVSVPAFGLYATLLGILSLVRRPVPPAFTRLLWSGLTAGATMAGLAAVWFIGLQVFLLNHLCPYCLAVHSCGIILAGLLLTSSLTTFRQKAVMASFGVTGVALLMTTQILTPEADNFEVIRYDVVDFADDVTPDPESAGLEVFTAPGDFFEAPGSEPEISGRVTNEASSETDSSPLSAPPTEPSKEAVKAESPQPVASNLLLILPPRFWMLLQLLGDLGQEPSADGASAAAAAEKGTTQSTQESSENTETAGSADKVEEPAKPERRLITVAGNQVTLDVRQWPLLGKPDAKYIFVEMFDYTCPHCRNTHHAIKGAFDHFGEDLAIVALPVPLDTSCNPYASGGGHAGGCELSRIAVAVWRVAPDKFREFHDWMFASSRTTASARSYAEQLVGAENFRKEFGSKTPADYVKRHVDLYAKVGKGSVPKLLFPKSTINGEVNSKTTLCRTIENELKNVPGK
jgi:uncharacterized membrane protein/protein-disulfide isomerase